MNPLLTALVAAGLLTQAEADAIARNLDPQQARAYAENVLGQAFQNGLSAQQRRILGVVDSAEGNPTQAELNRFWAGEDELLWQSVRGSILDIASERATVATIQAGAVDAWKQVNEAVLNYTDDYYTNADIEAVGSIPNLNITSRTRFASAFQDWQRGELDIQGRTATGELRQGLDALITALEPTFGVSRAQTIGVTETSRIFADSERQAAIANPFVTHLLWLTSQDELVCPICGPLANTVVGKEQDGFQIQVGFGFPPAHVNCRCSITQLTGPALDALRDDGTVPSAPEAAASEPEPIAPEPVVPTRLQPAGTPVSNALTVSKGKAKEQIETAIKAIDSVHGDGTLTQIPVTQRASKTAYGQYKYKLYPGGRSVPVEINIVPSGDSHTAITMAHEVGHFLDNQALRITQELPSDKITPEIQAWRDAIKDSDAVKTLGDWRRNGHTLVIQDSFRENMTTEQRIDPKYVAYQLRYDELWARSYAQYIASRSGDESMIAEISQVRASAYSPNQWADDDFVPIAKAIDEIMKAAGWLK